MKCLLHFWPLDLWILKAIKASQQYHPSSITDLLFTKRPPLCISASGCSVLPCPTAMGTARYPHRIFCVRLPSVLYFTVELFPSLKVTIRGTIQKKYTKYKIDFVLYICTCLYIHIILHLLCMYGMKYLETYKFDSKAV